MSSIPSDIAGSALQAGYQSRDASKVGDKEKGGAIGADGKRSRSVDEVGDIVETSDSDARVYGDAEGAGSQGRSFDEKSDGQPDDETDDQDASGVVHDDDGQVHLDLEA